MKLKHDGMWEWGIYDLNGWGSYGSVSYCFLGRYAPKKPTGLQGSIISGHRMNTAFCPFELPRIKALYVCTYAEMDKDEVF